MRATIDHTNHIRDAVQHVYSEAALHPEDKHPFPMGRHFAENIGYPPELLANLPSVSFEAFTGVSNVSVFADIPVGATVLDLGCGAGLDSFIAATRVGPTGKVIGVDFSDSMLSRAHQAAEAYGTHNVEFRQADAERLPLEDNMFDVALVNGIFNLNPAREAIFRELRRVLREGGTVFAAELILLGPLPMEDRNQERNWFA
jgi:arsenite methyltransferase